MGKAERVKLKWGRRKVAMKPRVEVRRESSERGGTWKQPNLMGLHLDEEETGHGHEQSQLPQHTAWK